MNPTLLLNMALTVLAAAAAIIAVGSETWDKTRRRPKKLGWIAIVLAIATAIVGIAKEVVTESEDARKARTAEAAQRAAETKAADLLARLSDANAQLQQVRADLGKATAERGELGVANIGLGEQLSDANGQLLRVHGDLRKANAELVELGAANAALNVRVSHVPAELHGFVQKEDVGRDRDNVREILPEGRTALVYDVVVGFNKEPLEVAGGETIKFALFFTQDVQLYDTDFVRVLAGNWGVTRPPDDALFTYPIPIRIRQLGERLVFAEIEGWHPVLIETTLPRATWEAAIVVVSPDSWALQETRDATKD